MQKILKQMKKCNRKLQKRKHLKQFLFTIQYKYYYCYATFYMIGFMKLTTHQRVKRRARQLFLLCQNVTVPHSAAWKVAHPWKSLFMCQRVEKCRSAKHWNKNIFFLFQFCFQNLLYEVIIYIYIYIIYLRNKGWISLYLIE